MRNLKLLFLAVTAQTAEAILPASCRPSKSAGIDFDCSERPYQPCEKFELVYGHATPSTYLWLVGELHSEKDDALACVEALTRKIGNHTIYLEGAEAGEQLSCKAYLGLKDKKGRTCNGWDNRKEVDKLALIAPAYFNGARKEDIVAQLLLLKKEVVGLSDESIDETLAKMKTALANSNEREKIRQQFPNKELNPKRIFEVINWLIEQRQAGKTYKEAFAAPIETYPQGANVRVQDLPEIEKINAIRNQYLCKTASNHPQGRFGLFITGYNHLIGPNAENLRKQLEQNKDKNPYAILVKPG